MKLWVLERGLYDDRVIEGIYATAEIAMQMHPVTKTFPPDWERPRGSIERLGGWGQDEDGDWRNGLDWDDFMHVYRVDFFTTVKPRVKE